MQPQDAQKQDSQKNNKEVANTGRSQSRGPQSSQQDNTKQDAPKEAKTGSDSAKSDSSKSVFGTLVDNLPVESREQISQLVSDSEGFFTKMASYIRAEPLEVAGIAAVGLGAFWVLSSTEPGRNLYQMGRRLVEPRINKWLSGDEEKMVKH